MSSVLGSVGVPPGASSVPEFQLLNTPPLSAIASDRTWWLSLFVAVVALVIVRPELWSW